MSDYDETEEMSEEMRGRAAQYAMELVLAGVLLSRTGDSKRLLGLLVPGLLSGSSTSDLLGAIKRRERAGVEKFMRTVGVGMLTNENAVDALVRSFITSRRRHLADLVLVLDAAAESEKNRREKEAK